jgi:hypothetical protein
VGPEIDRLGDNEDGPALAGSGLCAEVEPSRDEGLGSVVGLRMVGRDNREVFFGGFGGFILVGGARVGLIALKSLD